MRLTCLADGGPVVAATPNCGSRVYFTQVTEHTDAVLVGPNSLFHRRVVFTGKIAVPSLAWQCTPDGKWLRAPSSSYGSEKFGQLVGLFEPGTDPADVMTAPINRAAVSVVEDKKKVYAGGEAGANRSQGWSNQLKKSVEFDALATGVLDVTSHRGGVVDFQKTGPVHYILDVISCGIRGSKDFPATGYNTVSGESPKATLRSLLRVYWLPPGVKSGGSGRPSLFVGGPCGEGVPIPLVSPKREPEAVEMDLAGIPEAPPPSSSSKVRRK